MIKRNKRGQLQISFGMIFSIILIIAFIAVFIYVITIFMGWKKCASTGLFKEDLQSTVNNAWQSDQYQDVFPKSQSIVPSGITQICFIDQ